MHFEYNFPIRINHIFIVFLVFENYLVSKILEMATRFKKKHLVVITDWCRQHLLVNQNIKKNLITIIIPVTS